ncbi:MAG: hypothetical protein AAGI53_13000 [Planctomycetota bacterium]
MTNDVREIGSLARWLLRISAVLWVVWGLVHVFAGVITLQKLLTGNTASAIQGIASKVPIEELATDYHPAEDALLSQHGLNLAWFGLVTTIAAPFVWRGRRAMIYTAVLVGGCADLAYFIFIDLGGFANPPGPQMTWICAAAIATGLIALRLTPKSSPHQTPVAPTRTNA